MFRSLAMSGLVLGLSACATTGTKPAGPNYPDPDVENPGVIVIAEPKEVLLPAPEISAPPPPAPEPPEVEIYETPRWFAGLPDWEKTDHRPALISFKRSCESWMKAETDKLLNPNLPEYGRFEDWQPACIAAAQLNTTASEARQFFEDQFEPLSLSTREGETGLLTGYYEPEIDVRRIPDGIYSEPILAKPSHETTQNLPRKDITARSSRVIAYGRPIDVFFMQVQGSGRVKYKDGRTLRAAYAGNNGQNYKSIGRALIERGEMTATQASKQAISDWMEKAGPQKARELMNENPRYIFFAEQSIAKDEGPRGAMRVPLTEMGSLAVDPRYHPYGTLVWLSTTLPQKGGDFKGKDQGVLVSVQDTGNAIKGPLRGDLFFGVGKKAGDKAGVMKHPARWTILVPKAIAPKPETS